MKTIGLQTIVFIMEESMFDSHKPFQFHLNQNSMDENYWQLAYKLKLEVWFYLIFKLKGDNESGDKILLFPDPCQLEHYLYRNTIEIKSIYLLTPSYINKTCNWKIHKILLVRKSFSRIDGDLIIQCVLQGKYLYTVGLCDEEDQELLEFETLFSISNVAK